MEHSSIPLDSHWRGKKKKPALWGEKKPIIMWLRKGAYAVFDQASIFFFFSSLPTATMYHN